MCQTKFFSLNQTANNIFLGFLRKENSSRTLSWQLTRQKEIFLCLQQDLINTVYFFHSANLLTLKFEHCVPKESFITIIH